MKYMFISDIHGDVDRFNEALVSFNNEKADYLVLLGDTASSTSRNSNELISEELNKLNPKVEVIRGNCDSWDFIEMLNFETFDLDNLFVNGKIATVTHGHYYSTINLPENCGEIFLQGHTHIPMLQEVNGKILGNPGSLGRPRGTDLRCYIVIDKEKISLKTLEGRLVKEIVLS
ncbi:MAG: phosphodiesterase [Clostridia bacterium]|nr:phosphodiesterase [Clostridia bacterium]